MSWFSDLVDLGKTEIDREANKQRGQTGTSAHIAAQNQVVRDFETQGLTPYHAGQITPQQTIDVIDRLDKGFTAFCQQLGYARALQGAADVHALAQRIISGLQADLAAKGQPPYLPGTGATGIVPTTTGVTATGIQVAGLGAFSWTTIALTGIALYMLHRNRVF